MKKTLTLASVLCAILSTSTVAQKPPAVRAIGAVTHVSKDSLASVATALDMPSGRVLVNDMTARRVLLFDSTLSKFTVVADTTGATANAYGMREGMLIRFRRDSALFIDGSSLSMLVIGPSGNIARVMAMPRPSDWQFLAFGNFGTPGFDSRGRLVYFNAAGDIGYSIRCCLGKAKLPTPDMPYPLPNHPDSALIVRADLATRTVDTAASFRISHVKTILKADDKGFLTAVESTNDPLPLIDDWTVLRDGTVAIVRGRDYHVDWLSADGHMSSSPKMPFDWQRIDDARKQAIIDSSYKAEAADFLTTNEQLKSQMADPSVNRSGGGRGGAVNAGAATGARSGVRVPIPGVAGKATLNDVPDYVPPIREDKRGSAVHDDAEGNLWIRTTTFVKGQLVYDVVNRKGELVERVQLPPFRTIAGFALGVVYLAVKDSAGVVHLERVRIK